MTYMAVIYPGDAMQVYNIQKGRTPTLEWLQKQVSGHIEIVRLQQLPGIVLVVNEEGLLFDLPKNEAASDLYNGQILGNVIVMREMGCDLTGITMEDLAKIAAWTSQAVTGRKIEGDKE